MVAGDGATELVPNRLLWAARQARLLTQQQLAEAVGAAHWQLFQKEAPIDADHVSKLERGMITWPNARYREAFRTVLGAATDAELGFYSRRARSTVGAEELTDSGREVDAVRRDEFIRLMTGMGAGLGVASMASGLPDPVCEVLSLAVNPGTPGRVGRTEVEQVRYANATFRSWREQYGGGACRDALAGQVRWAAGLLQGRIDGSARRELYSVVGSLCDMAGWGDVDAGHHETALSCFRLALHCAEEAHDWDLRAEVLTDMSQQAVNRGQVDDALSLIELAQLRADRVTGTGRSIMQCSYARVLGIAGRVPECQDTVSAAEDHFADHQPAEGSPAASYFHQASEAYLRLDNGHALFHPSLTDPNAAVVANDKLRVALGYADIEPRRRVIGVVNLATLELLHGDRDEGLDLGQRALELADGMRSARLTDDLRRLRNASTRHAGPAVDALRRRLDSVLLVA
jgi:transcriptional regulator with XRE-family HTH domain